MDAHTLDRIISFALAEDIGQGDLTTELLIPSEQISEGYILLKTSATICGMDIVRQIFLKCDSTLRFKSSFKDGDTIPLNTKIIRLQGKTRAILSAERVALNFLSFLSAIATKTKAFVQAVSPYPVVILDTRKTTPGLRFLEKWAVRCAGGANHRSRLDEMVFVKDNHGRALSQKFSWGEMIDHIRRRTKKQIVVEVETLKQFQEVLAAKPDIILLDNMTVGQMRQAVLMNRSQKKSKKVLLEASGGIHLKNVRSIAKTGVDRISIGALTHSRQAIDFSLELLNYQKV